MTELIWDGKYKGDKKTAPVRIALPFQNIETVNESSADRQKNLELRMMKITYHTFIMWVFN